jgi:hypothetical protein
MLKGIYFRGLDCNAFVETIGSYAYYGCPQCPIRPYSECTSEVTEKPQR